MLFKSFKSLLLSAVRLTLFIVLFIDITNIRLQTSRSVSNISKVYKRELEPEEMFHMPTEEEQKARVAKWEKELVGKQLEDDLTEQQSDALGDGPSSHAGGSGEAEDRKEDDAKESKDDVKESKGDEGETADSKVVKLSTLPQPVRVIRPGSRVTRDLRPNRMNVVCDESGLILKVGFY